MGSATRLLVSSVTAVVLLSTALAAQTPTVTPRNPTRIPGGRPILTPRETHVWTVSPFPADLPDFPTIQAAVARARNGDIIVVKPSPVAWSDVTIDGKSLTLINESGVNDGVFLDDLILRNITGKLVVRGLRADRIEASASPGSIWIEQTGFQHLYPLDCETIVVTACTGGDIVGSNSNVAVWDTPLQGAFGPRGGGDDVCTCDPFDCFYDETCYTCVDDPGSPPGPGEPAVWLMGTSSIFLSGSEARGGPGGFSYCGLFQAGPGPAIRTTSLSDVTYLDTVLTGSAPLIEGNPTVTDYARTSGSYTVTSPVQDGADATATLAGQPDTQVFVVANPVLSVAPAPLRFGVLVVRLADSPSMYFGTVPMDGSPIVGSFPVGDLGPGEGSVLFAQSMFVEDLGGGMSETVLGAPSVLVQID